MAWEHRSESTWRGIATKGGNLGQCERDLRSIAEEIQARMLMLGQRWETCGAYDRILAVRRLLREGGLSAAVNRELALVSRITEQHFSSAREAHAAGDRVRGLLHEVELQLAERRRDDVLVVTGSVEALLRCGESYLLDRPYDRGMTTLQQLFKCHSRLAFAYKRLRVRALIEGTLAPRRNSLLSSEPHGDASSSTRQGHGVLGAIPVSDGDAGKRRAVTAAL